MEINVKPRHKNPSWAKGTVNFVDLLITNAPWNFELQDNTNQHAKKN